MAAISTGTDATASLPGYHQVGSGLINLDSVTIYPGDACYITVVNGVWGVKLAGGATYTLLTQAQARVDGFCAYRAPAGGAITLYSNVTMGNLLSANASTPVVGYLSNVTAGKYLDAAPVANARPCLISVGTNQCLLTAVKY